MSLFECTYLPLTTDPACAGCCRAGPVVALTEATDASQNSTGAITIYRRHNKPALGPVGDSLDDLEPPGGAIGARSALAAMTDNQTS